MVKNGSHGIPSMRPGSLRMCFLNSIDGDETEVLLEKKNLCNYGMVLPKNIPMVFVGFCGEITMPHPTIRYPVIDTKVDLKFRWLTPYCLLPWRGRDTTIPISLLLGLLMGVVFFFEADRDEVPMIGSHYVLIYHHVINYNWWILNPYGWFSMNVEKAYIWSIFPVQIFLYYIFPYLIHRQKSIIMVRIHIFPYFIHNPILRVYIYIYVYMIVLTVLLAILLGKIQYSHMLQQCYNCLNPVCYSHCIYIYITSLYYWE